MFSSIQPTKKYFIIMFFISSILLEVFTFVVYQQSEINKSSNDWVIHSYEVLRVVRIALLDAGDLSRATQDFLTTNDTANLKLYDEASAKLDQDSAEVVNLVADNDEQHKNVTVLLSRFKELKDLTAIQIDAAKKSHINSYSLEAFKAADHHSYSNARAAYQNLADYEAQLLDTRKAGSVVQRHHYILTLIIGALLGLAALLVANLVIFSLIGRNSRAEDKLRKSEELFSLILNGLNDGVYDYDVRTGLIEYSDSYYAMLGYKPEKFGATHEDFYEHVHPDDLGNVEVMNRYLNGETPNYYNTFRLRHKDGRWIWVLSRGIGIKDKDSKINRLIGTHTDITVQKQREEELNYFMQENEVQRQQLSVEKERAETASQAKSDFLATMSHEIRTPMNAVIGLGRLMLETQLDNKQLEMMETLYANADILLKLVNDLLDISRIESGAIELEQRHFTMEGVFKVLHSMFDSQAASKNLHFEIINHIGKQSFVGDPNRIQQILVNLIGNALKFTPSGAITLTADAQQQENAPTEMQVTITVADTGVGIAADKLPVIFEKFVQADQTISRRFGGSGLGLAISKTLLELMGGAISVVSNSNQGSAFTITLPLKISTLLKSPTAAGRNPAQPVAVSGRRVLVVEDYAANVLVATLMLESLGFAADVANSGAEALKLMASRSEPYAAILMDVQMQDMDGYETTRQIRKLELTKNWRHFIIGVTAHALAGDRDRCIEAGMDEYMSKPIHPDLLEQKLKRLDAKAA